MRVKREMVRVDMESFQGCEMSAGGNRQSYVPDSIISLKSIGEGDSSTESLREDFTS